MTIEQEWEEFERKCVALLLHRINTDPLGTVGKTLREQFRVTFLAGMQVGVIRMAQALSGGDEQRIRDLLRQCEGFLAEQEGVTG